MCSIASSRPSTTFTAMMASRNSFGQSSSVAGFTRGYRRAASPDRPAPRSRPRSASRPAAPRCVGAALRSTSSVSAAPHTPVRRILALSTIFFAMSRSAARAHRRGTRLRDARTPAPAPRPARARPGSLPPRGTITSMAPPRPPSMKPTAERSTVGTSWIAASRQPGLAPRPRSECWR